MPAQIYLKRIEMMPSMMTSSSLTLVSVHTSSSSSFQHDIRSYGEVCIVQISMWTNIAKLVVFQHQNHTARDFVLFHKHVVYTDNRIKMCHP